MSTEGRIHILVVDDNPQKLLAYAALLSDLDHNVVTAGSGRDALRELLHREFALILLDVNMPGMDGFETAALIRRRKSSEHTPIIFVTSYGDETHAVAGYSLGAVDYILAPVQPEILKTKVSVFVELYRKTSQVREQAEKLEQRTRQLQKLTEASLAINSALSIDRTIQVVAELGREILHCHQTSVVVAPDQKWFEPRSALSFSAEFASLGERRVLKDPSALLALLSRLRRTVRLEPADLIGGGGWLDLLASDRPLGVGWIAAPLTTRDGRVLGLLQALHRRDGEFTDDDAAVATQLAQMSSIAIENTLNAEAREANRIKDEFLTTLSHELRTPLSAILGWTRALRGSTLDPGRTSRGLEVIERNVIAQTRLIDDLLDVSRIITGKLRLNVRRARLIPVIEAAMESMRPAAEAKEIRIAFDSEVPEGSDEIVGDPDRLQQIVWNLFSNAIKFTPPRGRVEVAVSRKEPNFEIRVTDTGRGINPEFLAHVFDRFRQADSSTTRTQGGLGIGLAVARHLTELHGGTILAESGGPDRGATFRVQLPVLTVGVLSIEEPRPAALPLAEPAPEPVCADLTGLRILVVEDEPDGREMLVELLETCGATVAGCASAAEALDALERFRPDVLVSDIGLPERDGFWLIGEIRRRPANLSGNVPALAVSAYARQEDRLRSVAAGFQAHVAKPFEPSELTVAVARIAAVKRPGFGRGAGAQGPVGNPSHILVVEDDDDAGEALRVLLEDWGHAVEIATDGPQAIEMVVARPPAAALIDVGLPGLDGYEVARRLRRHDPERRPLLVALTGHASPEDRKRALESGFDAHLAKPLDPAKLSSLLAGIEGLRSEGALSEKEKTPPAMDARTGPREEPLSPDELEEERIH